MTHQTIKPIETSYNGYRFRYRLEARWAVFFDAVGWPYRYEPEGFEWRSGGQDHRYLPDFLLNTYHHPTWFEIKAPQQNEKAIRTVINRWTEFVYHAALSRPGDGFVLVFGDPYIDMSAHSLLPIDHDVTEQQQSKILYMPNGFLMQCPCCQGPSIAVTNDDNLKQQVWHAPKFNCSPYLKARRARFEHGESPAT